MVSDVCGGALGRDELDALERELALASRGPEHEDAAAHGDGFGAHHHAPPRPLAMGAPSSRATLANPHLAHWRAHLDGIRERNARALPLRPCGRLTRAAGLVLEAIGLRLSVGAECTIELPAG
ncbi:flagellum-specific ATP synthase FliI, partial [Burkholderia mallei]|nr:flagellum-specific ATP synthase FliI [Burkholderia mallei]